MNKAAERTPILVFVFIILLMVTGNAEAENFNSIITEDDVISRTVPARMILDHNKWLLDGTSIGYTLSSTPNTKAKKLFSEARTLYDKAVASLESGQEELAKELAFQSIRALYESDKQHYNLLDR